MIEPSALTAYCDELLDTNRFQDYAPNGLQVEGLRPVRRLVTGVTACAALIEAARFVAADAILVHHGWFWKGEDPCLVGPKGRRARALIASGASLIAYHLPLDVHETLGNNATLAGCLEIRDARPTPIGNGLVWQGTLADPLPIQDWAASVSERLDRNALLVEGGPGPVARIAWCTGGGQDYIAAAAGLGIDAYLSGEICERTTHLARELGICYLAAGHHATERYGVQALGEHLAQRFGLAHRFIDIDNPA